MLEAFFDKFALFQAKRSLPHYEGQVQVAGLRGKIRIAFDHARIPHIQAGCAEDVFMGQGYVHAMERMWQMEFARRVSAGRLAETFGNLPVNWKELTVHLRDTRVVDLDFFLRSLRLMWASERSVATLDDHTRTMLEAYCRGVNAWLAGRSHRRLPVEYRLLSLAPEPWTAVDAVSMAKAMAYHLNFAWKTILVQYAIAEKLPPNLARDLLTEGYPSDKPTILGGLGALLETDTTVREALGYRGTGLGSDSWVVAGSHTENGHPIVANDPHLRLRAPCIWYLSHLQGGEYDVQGITLPGMPGIVIGRNRSLAWGVTAAMLHDSDFYIERLNPDRADTYEVNGQFEPLELLPQEIKIRQGTSECRTVRVSRHGPLLSDVLPPWRRDGTQGLALKWVAHEQTTELEGVLAVNRARNLAELKQALSKFACPGQNFVYADQQGNIGYQLAAWIPRRKKGKGQHPVPGWNDDHEWVGYVPYEDNPWVENPPCGFIATANNQIADASYPYFLSYLWEPPYRICRIEELLKTKQSVSKTMAMQQDTLSLQARDFLARVVRPFSSSAPAQSLSEPAQDALGRLQGWDGACEQESVPASIFHVLLHELLMSVFGKQLGDHTLLAYLEHFNESVVKLEKILADPAAEWFGAEGRNGCVALALESSVRWLRRELGPNPGEWKWGRLHYTTFEHPMGIYAFTAQFFNLGPYPTAGSVGTLNAGQFFYAYPFRHYVGSSYRQVIDMSPADDSWYVLHTGQSGNPMSPHYRDQIDLWRHGRYLSMTWEAHGPVLDLHPAADL